MEERVGKEKDTLDHGSTEYTTEVIIIIISK